MADHRQGNVLILGIGNLLLGDEGVGIHAIHHLSRQILPPGIDLLDGGTSGADLVDHLDGRNKVIVIDAADGDGPPGTIYRCEACDLLSPDIELSLHEFGLLDSLHMAACLGCAPRKVIVLGVQPATMNPGLELSLKVFRALPDIVRLALTEAAEN